MDNRFALVEFQGSQHLTIFDGQTVRVAMKPLVEALGIDWRSQRQKIMADAVLSKGVGLSTTPSEGGPQQTLTLPIDLMHGWLFKLNPERVAPEARERVIAYQAECYQVLHDYWVKGAAVNPRMGRPESQQNGDLVRLLEKLQRATHPETRRILHELVVRACEAEKIAPPLLESFAPPSPEEGEAETALQVIDALIAAGVVQNWHRKPDLIAVRRKDVEPHGVRWTSAVSEALRRHPRFKGCKSVNSKWDGGIYCWVFQRAA